MQKFTGTTQNEGNFLKGIILVGNWFSWWLQWKIVRELQFSHVMPNDLLDQFFNSRRNVVWYKTYYHLNERAKCKFPDGVALSLGFDMSTNNSLAHDSVNASSLHERRIVSPIEKQLWCQIYKACALAEKICNIILTYSTVINKTIYKSKAFAPHAFLH